MSRVLSRRLVIEWRPFEAADGREIAFAHFPEPFQMDDAEFAAFEAVTSAWSRQHWQGMGEVRQSEGSPADLIAALAALGYEIEERGSR
jgi:hypothetical protein